MDAEGKPVSTAIFAAGCFWGPEMTFSRVQGVLETVVGYIGGTTQSPSYNDICTGTTNHAEAVQVEFDPDVISYAQLLDVFWGSHDPTLLNRQGPDVGTQYRSAIFCIGADQLSQAEASKKALSQSGTFAGSIVTSIEIAPTFWTAEEYHQKYLEKRGVTTCGF